MEATGSTPASPKSGPASLLKRFAGALVLILAALVGLVGLPPLLGQASSDGPAVSGLVRGIVPAPRAAPKPSPATA